MRTSDNHSDYAAALPDEALRDEVLRLITGALGIARTSGKLPADWAYRPHVYKGQNRVAFEHDGEERLLRVDVLRGVSRKSPGVALSTHVYNDVARRLAKLRRERARGGLAVDDERRDVVSTPIGGYFGPRAEDREEDWRDFASDRVAAEAEPDFATADDLLEAWADQAALRNVLAALPPGRPLLRKLVRYLLRCDHDWDALRPADGLLARFARWQNISPKHARRLKAEALAIMRARAAEDEAGPILPYGWQWRGSDTDGRIGPVVWPWSAEARKLHPRLGRLASWRPVPPLAPLTPSQYRLAAREPRVWPEGWLPEWGPYRPGNIGGGDRAGSPRGCGNPVHWPSVPEGRPFRGRWRKARRKYPEWARGEIN